MNGIQDDCERKPALRMKSTGQRFSVKSRPAPTAKAKLPSTTPGIARPGTASASADFPAARLPSVAPHSDDVGGRGTRCDDRELRPREADKADGDPGEPGATASHGEELEQEEEEPHRRRVGVREDEVEGRAGEPDREEDGRGEPGGRGSQPLAREDIEDAENGRRLREAEGERER